MLNLLNEESILGESSGTLVQGILKSEQTLVISLPVIIEKIPISPSSTNSLLFELHKMVRYL